MTRPPDPGSPEARLMGCTCPADVNGDGAGTPTSGGDRLFVIVSACPVHGVDGDAPDEADR